MTETDIIDDVDFNGLTPEIIFNEEALDNVADETYYGVHSSYVSPYYNGEKIDVESLIFIGVKGDANLNGLVELDDVVLVLQYYAYVGASLDTSFTGDPESVYEILAFFLSDVNTESTDGKNTENGRIELSDASDIITYYALRGASLDPQWDEVIPSLKELEGSLWHYRAMLKAESEENSDS